MILTVFMKYVSNQFLKHFIFLLLGLTAMLVVFDVLAHSKDVLANQNDALRGITFYIRLRLSSILNLVIPISSFFALMILFTRLVKFHEMEAFRSAGFSIYKIMRRLTPAIGGIIICHFILANTFLASDSRILQGWQEREYSGNPWDASAPMIPDWVVVDNKLINVGSVGYNGKVLYDLKVIKRDESGKVLNSAKIDKAFYVDGKWRFLGFKDQEINSAEVPLVEKDVNLPFDPDAFLNLGELEASLNIWQLRRLVKNTKDVEPYKSRQYALWFQRKLVGPLASYIMLILTLPLCFLVSRQPNFVFYVFLTIFIGFSYYIAERLLMSLGEAGHLPVMISAWAPFALYAMSGFWVLFIKEP